MTHSETPAIQYLIAWPTMMGTRSTMTGTSTTMTGTSHHYLLDAFLATLNANFEALKTPFSEFTFFAPLNICLAQRQVTLL